MSLDKIIYFGMNVSRCNNYALIGNTTELICIVLVQHVSPQTVRHSRHYIFYKFKVEYVKIALSEVRSVLQCSYHVPLQAWFL